MKRFSLILLILCSIHFWRYYMIPPVFHNLTDLISLLVMGLSFVKVVQEKGQYFKVAIIIFIVGVFANILSAKFNNGQAFRDTFLSFGPYYFILFYFFLHEQKIERKELENIIIAFALIYSVFYWYQLLVFPNRIFVGAMFADRGTIRIKIEGSGFLMLAFFMVLNRYLVNQKLINVFFALVFFVILLKGGFRSLTLGAVLMSGILFLRMLKHNPANFALVGLAVVMFIGLLQTDSAKQIIDNMMHASEKQKEMGDQYIRKLEYNYFFHEYPANWSYYVVGGGLPGGYSEYSRKNGYMVREFGFFWVDLGLLGFFIVIGAIATLGILLYALRAFFIKVPPDSFYLNAFFGYLLIVSYYNMEIYRNGMFVVEAIALYLIDLARKEYKEGLARV